MGNIYSNAMENFNNYERTMCDNLKSISESRTDVNYFEYFSEDIYEILKNIQKKISTIDDEYKSKLSMAFRELLNQYENEEIAKKTGVYEIVTVDYKVLLVKLAAMLDVKIPEFLYSTVNNVFINDILLPIVNNKPEEVKVLVKVEKNDFKTLKNM